MSQDTLSLILKRIDAPIEPVFNYDEVRLWPDGDLELIVDLGLLREMVPAKSVVCDGCEEACIENVVYIDGPKKGQVRAYIVCRNRDDIGRIEVPLERLKRWIVDLVRLGATVKELVGADGRMEEVIRDRLWWLGNAHLNNQRVEIFLAFGATWPDAREMFAGAGRLKECAFPLVFVLSDVAAAFPIALDGQMLSLLRLMSLQRDGLVMDMEEIGRAVAKSRARRGKALEPFPTPRGATWEQVAIEFVSEIAVKITAGSVVQHRTYDEMGFADSRGTGNPPNVQWELLRQFAKGGGSLRHGDSTALVGGSKKKVSDLRKLLKRLFGLSDDPFKLYRTEGGYETRFVILYSVAEDDFR